MVDEFEDVIDDEQILKNIPQSMRGKPFTRQGAVAHKVTQGRSAIKSWPSKPRTVVVCLLAMRALMTNM